MRAIVAGAGSVGLAAATVAARNGTVVIMERDPARGEIARNIPGASVIRNDASNPRQLRRAIEQFHPEILISAVDQDGINIFICDLAKTFDSTIKTVATLKDSDYVMEEGNPGVDAVIAPRSLVADRIVSCALTENAVSFSRIRPYDICAVLFRISKDSKLVGMNVMDIAVKDGLIAAIFREDEVITSVYSSQIHQDDRVLVFGNQATIDNFNNLVGITRPNRNITIIGAGELGIAVAKLARSHGKRQVIKVIDRDIERCNAAARKLKGAVIVNGETGDPVFLRSENVDRADAVIAASESEEENLLVCMNAIRFGVEKIIPQYSSGEYGDLLRYSGIESIVGYHNVIINEAAEEVSDPSNPGDSAFAFDRPGEYVLGIEVDEKLPFQGKLLGDIYFPEDLRLVAIIRGEEVIYPGIMDRALVGDRLLFYTPSYDIVHVTRTFGRQFMGI